MRASSQSREASSYLEERLEISSKSVEAASFTHQKDEVWSSSKVTEESHLEQKEVRASSEVREESSFLEHTEELRASSEQKEVHESSKKEAAFNVEEELSRISLEEGSVGSHVEEVHSRKESQMEQQAFKGGCKGLT